MYFMEHSLNKRINNGYFPLEKLFPAPLDINPFFDLDSRGKEGITIFQEDPALFQHYFILCRKKIKEIDTLRMLHGADFPLSELNCLINARCSTDFLPINTIPPEEISFFPAVTQIDKTFWFGAFLFFTTNDLCREEIVYEKMMFSWIYLLDKTQKMEMNTGFTIDVDKMNSLNSIIDIVFNYEKGKNRRYLRKLSKNEITEFENLNKKKNNLQSIIQKWTNQFREVAERTEKEWELFLEIINDLSEKESSVIENIVNSVSAKDKIKYINEYKYNISCIDKGYYVINGAKVRLLPIFDAVNERIINAGPCSSVLINDNPLRLNPLILGLAIKPQTFNYLLIVFHQFRINPNKETAKEFTSLSLSFIRRNLGYEEKTWISLDEMIEDFYNTVFDFMKNRKSSIDTLSFTQIQPDVVTMYDSITNATISESTSLLHHAFVEKIDAIINDNNYEKEIERIAKGKIKIYSKKEILAQEKEYELLEAQTEKEAIARQIIVSLNIIYLFCDALRIMLINNHTKAKIKKKDNAEKYRIELLKLDDELVHKVYAHLDNKEMGMLEYRDTAGINSYSLSEREKQEEKYRNSVFSDVLKSIIENIADGIENENIDSIIAKNNEIRKEIFRYPDCDEKERYAHWLDDISCRISAALIEICKHNKDDFQAEKAKIKSSLGQKSNLLPESTIDSLSTAEILYRRYASSEYAQDGFDFSCISALYFQAFEDAYNELIWRNYATYLNNLQINGQSFPDILDSSRSSFITDPNARGYLDDDPYQRKYYIVYRNRTNNPQTHVDLRCMYKSFAIIMKIICNPSPLDGFCEYFANLTGFSGRVQMFSDTSFMSNCQRFAIDIENSADDRNNASHGGTFISINQCVDDKKKIIDNLAIVRDNSYGLIQQLLYLLQKD